MLGTLTPHAPFSPAAVPDLAVRRRCSSSYVWIPAEVLYVQHIDDRGIGSDRGLHCPERRATSTFRTCASSGNHRGLLPRLDLGLPRRKSFFLFISTWPNSGIRVIASGFRPLIAHMRYVGGSRLYLFAVLEVGFVLG